MPRIGILDYKVGNVFSLKTSLEKVSSERIKILSSCEGLEDLDALALSGVGRITGSCSLLLWLRETSWAPSSTLRSLGFLRNFVEELR